ncbi:MAG: hypothetical protein RIG82_08010 [Phycisphaeraceae bacterium]
MNLHVIDLLIIFGLMALVLGAALYTRRYTHSVADFLSANRCAGRYMLTLAGGIAGLGAISIVAMWEQYYQAGFAGLHWGSMLAPLGLILALSGWVIYRYRETRALTLAQFLERRYSRRFRVFAGTLAWIAGVLNYGIFPAVTGRFLIYFLGLPKYIVEVPGIGLELNLTLGLVMGVVLGMALLVTLNGGQIAVMASDFIQAQASNIVFLILLGVMLYLFPWSVIIETLSQAPKGESKINPFDQGELPDFNPWFFFIQGYLYIYTFMVWQGSQGYNSSARSPHEAKMAGILGQFRAGVTFMLIPLAAVCAYVLMHAPAYEEAAASAQATLDAIGDPQIAKQMTTTVALAEVLPVGMMGMLAAVMLMAALSTDSTYMHSWGSIFVQDVYLPYHQLRKGRNARLDPKHHLRLLRWSIFGIAVFAWCFSMVFPLREYIAMYFAVTGAIFTGGAGAVLIGGLYWARGTVTGAWAAMFVGCGLAVTGALTVNLFWPEGVPYLKSTFTDTAWVQNLPDAFWLNGIQMAFVASVAAVGAYIVGSLMSEDPELDMDKLLHRGEHQAKAAEGVDHIAPPARGWRALGFTPEFTLGDKVIYCMKLAYVLFFFITFVVFTVWNLWSPWEDQSWVNWWWFQLVFIGTVGGICTVWFIIGGILDWRKMFRLLASIERDADDDGTVTVHLGQARADMNEADQSEKKVP